MNDNEFINQTMITYLGNKRKLINKIQEIIKNDILPNVNKDKLSILDGFAGSSVVSRCFAQYSDNLTSNDLELYSYIMLQCFLSKPDNDDIKQIYHHIDHMNDLAKNGPYQNGIITELYSPENTNDIKEGERCFYSKENALIIDTLRIYIKENVDEKLFHYCIAPLLIKASIHTNSSGQFRGFYKNKKGIGQWGGENKNDLKRILKPIELEYPLWSDYDFNTTVYNKDINELMNSLSDNYDLIYLDPPYNEHPYASNYHMLNLIIKYEKPEQISKVSGIAKGWNRSDYNYEKKAVLSMKELIMVSVKKSKYILLSYNNEGIIPLNEWEKIFEGLTIQKYEIPYDTFKGSRNLKERSNKVMEIMYLISNK